MVRHYFMLWTLLHIACAYSQVDEQTDFNVIRSFIVSLRLSRVSSDDITKIAHCCVVYGQKFNVDPLLIASLIYRESAFNPQAVSVSDAKGLGQIKALNFADLAITDPFNIEQNIRGTAKYLRRMLSLWPEHPQQTEFALASYFKGYTRIKYHMNMCMDRVTSRYVGTILNKHRELVLLKDQCKTL